MKTSVPAPAQKWERGAVACYITTLWTIHCTLHLYAHYTLILHTTYFTLHPSFRTSQSLKHSPLLLRTVLCGSLRASLRGLQVNRPYRHPPHCLLSGRGGTKVAPSGLLPASGSEIVAPGQDHRSSRWSCQCLTRQCVSESVDPSFSVTVTHITILLISTCTIYH